MLVKMTFPDGVAPKGQAGRTPRAPYPEEAHFSDGQPKKQIFPKTEFNEVPEFFSGGGASFEIFISRPGRKRVQGRPCSRASILTVTTHTHTLTLELDIEIHTHRPDERHSLVKSG